MLKLPCRGLRGGKFWLREICTGGPLLVLLERAHGREAGTTAVGGPVITTESGSRGRRVGAVWSLCASDGCGGVTTGCESKMEVAERGRGMEHVLQVARLAWARRLVRRLGPPSLSRLYSARSAERPDSITCLANLPE